MIPAALRRELELGEGTLLTALVEGGGVLLLPRSEVKARLRAMVAGVRTSMADELASERRAEARADST